MGFGGGAMVAAPLDSYLLSYYSSPPTLLGGIDQVQVVTEGGVRMAESGTLVRKERCGQAIISNISRSVDKALFCAQAGRWWR